jgi:hypothetical protein
MPRKSNIRLEVLFQSKEERDEALAQIPTGDSASNYLRRAAFGLPPLQHGGVRIRRLAGKPALNPAGRKLKQES